MQIIGHRGARNEAPENTLAGFQHLRKLGLHFVELDVRLSKDQQLMVLHDATVNRTTDSKGYVGDLLAEQMQAMDASLGFPTSPQTHIPTLNEVIEGWPELSYIQLEVKSDNNRTLEVLAKKLSQLVIQNNLLQRAVVTSSDQTLLSLMHKTAPNIHRGFVAERFTRNPIEVCLNHHCSHLVINHHRCSPNLIAEAHSCGLIVSVWTVNNINKALKLQHWGADSIITDNPSLMLQQFLRHE